MKVLLLENVANLGKVGDIVEVKDGYGKNFLIAKDKAKLATNEVINKYKAELKAKKEAQDLLISEAKLLSKTLESITLNLEVKSGDNGVLFGAITKDDIALALNQQHNIFLDKKTIEIPVQIKQLGLFEVKIKLGNSINANLKIEVKAL